MNPWLKIDRHARFRYRAWRVARIALVVASSVILLAVGAAYLWR